MSQPAEVTPNSVPDAASPLRFVTAASLFDGHDAAINIMRRLIQAQGVEVIHLGHNRSVQDIVDAAVQEDADAIAVSSYQGGHMEFFRYMVDLLKEHGAGHIRVFGGGGGTITPEEIRELEAYGVERIYHPDDGMNLGLVEMIGDVVRRAAENRVVTAAPATVDAGDPGAIARVLSALEDEVFTEAELKLKRREWQGRAQAPVIGITGTGGAGKSSVTDELLNRFAQCFPAMRIAVLAVDPTRRRTGGALLGDRIRLNALRNGQIYMRSMATRRQHLATSAALACCSVSLARAIAASRGRAASRLVTIATAVRPAWLAAATANCIPGQSASPGIVCSIHCTPFTSSCSAAGRSAEGKAFNCAATGDSINTTLRSANTRTAARGSPSSRPATSATPRRRSSRAEVVVATMRVKSIGICASGPASSSRSKRFSARWPSLVHV